MDRLRLIYRSLAALPFLFTTFMVVLPLQNRVVGPLLQNHTFLPRFIHKGMRAFFGLNIEFNQASAPIEKDKKSWYVANHMSPLDPVVLAKILPNTSFVAAGWLQSISQVKAIGKAARTLFVSQKKDEYYKRRDRGKVVEAFNDGKNIGMFPEGWTNDGSTVELFRAGLAEILYGGKALGKKGKEVSLNEDNIVMQPIAIKVKKVNGKDASDNSKLRQIYSMHGETDKLKRIFSLMANKSITLEITAFEPLDPRDFDNAKDLMNEAHRQITAVVAPDQTTVTKAPIEAIEGENKTVRDLEL